MTKKRRNLRILASIIAAGCVWATGMGNAWADATEQGRPQNYLAIGTSGNPFTVVDSGAKVGDVIQTVTISDGSRNGIAITIEGGTATDKVINYYYENIDYPVIEQSTDGNQIDLARFTYKENSSASGRTVYYNPTNGKYYEDTGLQNEIDVASGNLSQNMTQQTYLVRDGFHVKPITERYHPDATILKIDAVKVAGGNGDYSFVSKAGEHSAVVTSITTAINNVPLDKINYVQYVALTNSSTYNTTATNQFYIKQGEEYIDVGNGADKLYKNFYVFDKDSSDDFNSYTQKYKFNGVDVEYSHVYNIDGNLGVFLDKQNNAVTFSGGSKTDVTSEELARNDIGVYKGTVYGYNNEVLLSGYNDETKTWSTVWAAEITDPSATISEMKVEKFNNIIAHLHEEDVKLAMEDTKVTRVRTENGINIVDFQNKAGNIVPGFKVEGGGGNNVDTFVKISGVEATVEGHAPGSFTINTGSVVSATLVNSNNYATNNKKHVGKITINGNEYQVDYVTNHTLSQDATDKSLLVSTITTSAGNTFTSKIKIGDFWIDYDGQNNNQTGQGGSQGGNTTITETTIENSINNNYNYIHNVENVVNQGWSASVDDADASSNQYPSPNIKMGETLAFKSDDNIVLSTTVNDGTSGSEDSIKIALNKKLTGLTSITLVDGQNQHNKVEINPTTINMNGGDITNVNNITTRHIKLGDNNNTTEINYQTTNEYGNRITYQDGGVTQYVANLNDGLTFAGDSGSAEVDLNKQVKIYGGATEYATGRNIGVVASSNNENGANLEVKLAKNLTGIDTIQVNNSITVGDIQINKDGRITNVNEAAINENSTDVVVGSQLYQVQQEINAGNAQLSNRLDRLGNRVDKVGAGAAALAALHPLDFDPDDKLQFSAGVGNYRGETAAALGAFYRPTEKVMFSVAGTMGNDDNMVSAGVTFALDRKNNVSNSRVAMAHEIKDLREQVAALTALVSQIAGKGNPLLDTVMFPDVPENHWAYDYVESLQKRGIIEGYPDGNFAGDRSMTRYEYAAMLYRALEKGFPVDGRLLKEFEAELGRIRIDRIKGTDDDANKVERVRVNDYEGRDDYGSKLAQVVADAAPVVEEEPAA